MYVKSIKNERLLLHRRVNKRNQSVARPCSARHTSQMGGFRTLPPTVMGMSHHSFSPPLVSSYEAYPQYDFSFRLQPVGQPYCRTDTMPCLGDTKSTPPKVDRSVKLVPDAKRLRLLDLGSFMRLLI